MFKGAKLLILFCLFAFVGCAGKAKTADNESVNTEEVEEVFVEDLHEVIEIPVYTYDTESDSRLSRVATDVSFIRMDEEPLIHYFFTIDIALTDDYIFMQGPGYLSQYDRKGRFIRSFGASGMGPAEYVNLYPRLGVDTVNQKIYANDLGRLRIVVYNFDGTYDRSIYIKDAYSIYMPDSETILIPQSIAERGNAFVPTLRFMDLKGKITKTLPSYIYPVNVEKKRFGPDISFIWQVENRMFYHEFANDTIFRIEDQSLVPARILTGNAKPAPENSFNQEDDKKLRIYSYIQRANAGIFEGPRNIIFKLSGFNETFYQVYDKSTRKLHRTNYTVPKRDHWGGAQMDYFIDDMVSGMHINFQHQSAGKAMILIPAHEILEQKEKILDYIRENPTAEGEKLAAILEQMDEEDNPLLVMVTLR